ncbi:MAG: pyruvate:ferredoxin (flavodoxin) oxidoreductase [Polyangiaceae bacterium]
MSRVTLDGNEAVASVAYRLNEVIAIYPITPASSMGELSDAWAAQGKPNLWGQVPSVVEMQSEGGAAGAVHGSLQAGSLTTTFTASQGLLLMIPNLYKIAGELSPMCLHVAARTVATHALSIFGDHSDVMACRGTGMAMLCSASVQEAQDMACIGQIASLASRVPFLHFFDGFRTSHEVATLEPLSDDQLRAMLDPETMRAHRGRALTPDRPVLRGTAQNPDVFFQAREACNSFYDACPQAVERAMARFAEVAGRRYGLFDYFGHPEAEHVVVVMGSGAETVREVVLRCAADGQRVGVVVVRLYRPFSAAALLQALPRSVKRVAVLDRTKEPGSAGEPLFQDVLTAIAESDRSGIKVIGGRYGLSSKEFTPAMVRGILDELAKDAPKTRFTVGIVDDVTHLSLPARAAGGDDYPGFEGVFWGLGSDGTVGANKNSIKIIGEHTGLHAQGYFVYDSKKSGAVTVSHLRFGEAQIAAPYLIERAGFVACHQFSLLEQFDVLATARKGATFLLNSPYPAESLWQHLPREVQECILEKELEIHIIDATRISTEAGLGRRINTVMQVCFFALSGVLPKETAIELIKGSIAKAYGSKGDEVVHRNVAAVDATLAALEKFEPPRETNGQPRRPVVPSAAPDFVQRVTAVILEGKGDHLPVSAFPVDGTWPTATSQWEKRDLALEIPIWEKDVCIQCNKCTLACPHAAIRAKVYAPEALGGAPDGFETTTWKAGPLKGQNFTLQVAPEDCTGCGLCVAVCPAKDKASPRRKAINMQPQRPVRDAQVKNYDFFLKLPEVDASKVTPDVKHTQLLQPLFEYSGACAGCGETPYIKLLTQLFGDRLFIANATGCSSIYGGNLPTTPYTVNPDGRGPAWSNSLFEDNAEFGFGMRLSVDAHAARALHLLRTLGSELNADLVREIADAPQADAADVAAQRERVASLRKALVKSATPAAKELLELTDYLVKKSVWIVGGDGWAYDIGYGGLDHVLASDRNVNVLVLDTEVYSNTGGQASKATPLGAAAKFASAGKAVGKKDLGLAAMNYGHVYVARVAFGAKDAQTLRAFLEAEAYPGPSLIIAYSHCIAHGYDLVHGATQQKLAVDSGVWPLFRYDPRRVEQGLPPLELDVGAPKAKVGDYMRGETRFRMVERMDRERFHMLMKKAEHDAHKRVALYEQLAHLSVPKET